MRFLLMPVYRWFLLNVYYHCHRTPKIDTRSTRSSINYRLSNLLNKKIQLKVEITKYWSTIRAVSNQHSEMIGNYQWLISFIMINNNDDNYSSWFLDPFILRCSFKYMFLMIYFASITMISYFALINN